MLLPLLLRQCSFRVYHSCPFVVLLRYETPAEIEIPAGSYCVRLLLNVYFGVGNCTILCFELLFVLYPVERFYPDTGFIVCNVL